MASPAPTPEACTALLARLQAGLAQPHPGPAALRLLLADANDLAAAVHGLEAAGDWEGLEALLRYVG